MKTSPHVKKNIAMAAKMGIVMETEIVEGTHISVRKVECWNCGAVETQRHQPSAPPQLLRQRFERVGWVISSKGCICPACAKSKKPTITQVVAGHIQDIEYQDEKTMSKSNVVSIQPPVEDSPRQPSPSDKATIRQFLDGHFDDSKGMYLDGCNDEKAGLELNMPWAWVRDIREFAYGPIKVDPEIASLKAEINAISPKIAEVSKTIAELSKTAATLMGTVANIAGRIKRLEG